jgi:predicted carbohydrate-binding protein with CBM5 and CBM33 domain
MIGELWIKADNWDPTQPPYPDAFGLVPEYNEYDNVAGPIRLSHKVYLPVVWRNHLQG